MSKSFYSVREFKPAQVKQAFYFLQFGLFLVFAIQGADKFFNVLSNWEQYLPGVVLYNIPLDGKSFMEFVGIVEVVIALSIIYRPKLGGYLAAGGLGVILLMLALIPGYFNIMVVDFGLLCASLALAKLSQ